MYQIKEWDKYYENAASRKVDFCSWCPVPNKQDGLGYTLLVQGRNGSARYGAFVAVLMVASKQEKPRNGWLTHNGKPDGRALTSYDLSLVTKLPEKIIEEMLLRASQPDIDWISPSSDSVLPAVYQQSDSTLERSGNIREQKEQKGTEDKSPATSVAAQSLEWFKLFWTKEIWGDLRGKVKAEEAWLKIDNLDEQLFGDICRGAVAYKTLRFEILKSHGTPKMAQGWLNDRRWEDDPPKAKSDSDGVDWGQVEKESGGLYG